MLIQAIASDPRLLDIFEGTAQVVKDFLKQDDAATLDYRERFNKNRKKHGSLLREISPLKK